MFNILGMMLSGIVIGYLLRNFSGVGKIHKPIFITVILLLFMLGLSIGMNRLIIENLSSLGWQAMLLALGGTAGSVLLSTLCYQLFFRKEEKK